MSTYSSSSRTRAAQLFSPHRTQNYDAEWTIKETDPAVKSVSYEVEKDNYRTFMGLFIKCVAITRDFGYTRINLSAKTKTIAIMVRNRTLYIVAIHDGEHLYEIGYGDNHRYFESARFTKFGEKYRDMFKTGKLYGYNLSRKVLRDKILKIANNKGEPSKWKGSAGIFALMIAEPGRFWWLLDVLTVVMAMDGLVCLEGLYRWMGWLPKHWRDISDVARFRPRIDDILTDQEDIKTNGGAAKLLEVRVWAANSLIFLTWVRNESSLSVQRILQEFGATRSYNPSYDTIDVMGGGEMANAVGEEEMETDVMVSREMTNDGGILGETVSSAAMESMKESIAQFFHSTSRVPGVPPQFPGPHPKFLNRENLELLRQKDYWTTWKAEGTRYMMLITLSGCYLIDQNFEFKKLQFPCGNANEGATTDGKPQHLTLLDGEMVIHTDPITKKQERRYLVFDMIAINGKSLVHEPFSQRWDRIEKEVIKPWNSKQDIWLKSNNPFRVIRKEFYPLRAVPRLLKEIIPYIPYASGLIFQPEADPYVSNTRARQNASVREGLFKWKYPERNSLDFLLKVGNNHRPVLYLNGQRIMDENGGTESGVPFRDPSASEDISLLSEKIIECSWDSKANEWVFVRLRPNKITPSEFSTYKEVMESNKVTKEDILNSIDHLSYIPVKKKRKL